MKKYPTADKNAHPLRLLSQGIPYFFSRSGYSFPPLSVFIHVNNSCNLKCKMCDGGQADENSMFYKNLSGSESGKMPINSLKSIVYKVQKFKPFIGIPAMEPLMYPHIIEAVRYIKAAGLRCSVATNGTLLEEMAEDIMKSGLTKIVISLDGTAPVHDRIRGVPGTYARAVKGILKLAELKKSMARQEPYIYINYVIQEDNYNNIYEFVSGLPLDAITQVDFRVMFYCTKELAEKHNQLFGDKYDATSACLAGGINLDNVDTDAVYDQMINAIKADSEKCKFFFNHGRKGLATFYHDPEVFLDETKCVMAWYAMQINTDGSVIPAQRCYHQVFGNIVEQPFEDVWNGERYRQFRKDLMRYGRFPACTRCEGVNF